MQPTPKVSHLDVDRVVRRDFSAARFSEVLAMLSEYGVADYHQEIDRVRLAILKLTDGNWENLRGELEVAKRDYRDTLSYAEYRAYAKAGLGIARLSTEERQKIVNADLKVYNDWLSRV